MTRHFIFYTFEGETYSPLRDHSDISSDESHNLQIIGFAQGNNEQEAFENLVKENDYLLETTFNHLTMLELKTSIVKRTYVCLDEFRPENERID